MMTDNNDGNGAMDKDINNDCDGAMDNKVNNDGNGATGACNNMQCDNQPANERQTEGRRQQTRGNGALVG